MAKLVRTDKNGTKYWVENKCPKCGGTGYIAGYEFIEGGICFMCGGTGFHAHSWKEYTPEYAKKLADRRLEKVEKARKKSAEINKQWLERNGFSADGKTWVVLGNTYEIKDELKAAGAYFNNQLGWHFNHEAENCFMISVEEVTYETIDYRYDWKADVFAIVKELKDKNAPKTDSEYVGEVGQKIEINVKHTGCHTYTTHYTYYGETHYIYTFKDENGNTIIWNTSSYQEFVEGKNYKIKGTIKKHNEYKGDKQTELTRCRVA